MTKRQASQCPQFNLDNKKIYSHPVGREILESLFFYGNQTSTGLHLI